MWCRARRKAYGVLCRSRRAAQHVAEDPICNKLEAGVSCPPPAHYFVNVTVAAATPRLSARPSFFDFRLMNTPLLFSKLETPAPLTTAAPAVTAE